MTPRTHKTEHLWLLVVLLAAMATLWLYGSIDHTVSPYRDWDLRSYLTMAEAAPQLSTTVHQPFAYRLLGPYLIGLLPVTEAVGFRWLMTLTLLGLAALFYRFLLAQEIAPRWAACAAILLMLGRSTIGFIAWDYFQLSDALSLLQLVGLYWLMQRRRWGWFAGLLVVAAFTRETALLLLPVLPVFLWETHTERREWARAGIALLPGLMTFALLRLLVPIGGGPSLVQSLTTHIGKLLNPESWLRLLVFPFMPLTFLPLVLIPKSIRFGRERRLHLAVYVLAVLGSALFGSNHERLVAPAFLAFYWLIAQLLQETSDYSPRWLVPVTLGLAVLTSLHHEFTRYALPFRSLTMSFSLGSLALVTLSWGWVTWREVAKERRDRWTPIAGG